MTESPSQPQTFSTTNEPSILLSKHEQEIFGRLAPRFVRQGLVKSLIIASGFSLKNLARKIGCHTSDLSRVVSGTRKTRSIREAIAQELQVNVQDLWCD